MKHLILLSCLILGITITLQANTNDSCALTLTKQDSLSLQIDYLIARSQTTAQPTFEQPVTTLNQFYAQANVFQKVGKMIKQAINWVARGSGHYKEEGMKKEGPYFLFDRNTNETVNAQLGRIRTDITNKTNSYRDIYQLIYTAAGTTAIIDCSNSESQTCLSAASAKASAFVYLVGLNASGVALSTTDREGYRNRALTYLREVNPPGLNGFFNLMSTLTPTDLIWDVMTSAATWNQMQYRCKELAMLIQTLDMLRWCSNIDGSLSVDEDDIDDACKHLKKQYVIPMHRKAQHSYYFTHNNFALMPAAVLGMAAIELNDYGAAPFFYDRFPKRWSNAAKWAIERTMWHDGIWFEKMSDGGKMNGFAEGTHYFRYSFELLLPYFKARYNFSNKADKEWCYPNGVLGYPNIALLGMPRLVGNFRLDDRYEYLFKWYNQIMQPDSFAPAIDDSYHNGYFNGALAIWGKNAEGQNYNFVNSYNKMGLVGTSNMSLREDYLAALQPPNVNYPQPTVQMDGYTVLRSKPEDSTKHYLLALSDFPKKRVVHAHPDLGSFIIATNENILMMDPPYFGGDNKGYVNDAAHHNTMRALGNDILSKNSSEKLIDIGTSARFAINFKWKDDDRYKHKWKRQFEVFREDTTFGYYYIITDWVENDETNTFSFALNGNGNIDDNPSSFSDLGNGEYKWYWPCRNQSTTRWGIKARLSVSLGSSYQQFSTNIGRHGNSDGNLTQIRGGTEQTQYGSCSQVKTLVTTNRDFSLTTYLYPIKCSGGTVQKTALRNTGRYGLITVNSGVNDNEYRVHVSKPDGTLDTIMAPMGFDSTAVLQTNGFGAYLAYDKDSVFKSSYCLSYANIRRIGITNGTTLTYNNKPLIDADVAVSVQSNLIGKFKYKGYINASAQAQVTLYMPDVERYYPMVARNAKTLELIPSEHSDTSATQYKYITVTFPAGVTEFILELENPCLMSCFFPPTASTIDSIFDFNTGTTETLGHELDIVKDSGELRITAGSKMSICPDYYLYNRDSIVMSSDGVNSTESYALYAPEVDMPGGTGIADTNYLKRFGSDRSMIIVNDKAALILDSGSYTHVGSGSTILIRKGGTLLVKKFATLEIGSNNLNNYGEVIVEAGAYMCIEDSSDLHFFVTEQDTNDRNVFFIPVDKGVNEGVNPYAIQDKFKAGSGLRFDEGYDCLPLCSLWYYMEDYGVNNPDFGLNSVGKPEAFFKLPDDTICSFPSDTIYINAKRSRNEAKYRIYATRTGLADSIYFRQQATDYQRLTHNEMIDLSSLGTTPGTINIMVVVENVCGDTDAMVQSIYIPPSPTASFTLSADSICAGAGTLTANGSSSSNGLDSINHIWSVILIDTNQYSVADTNRLYYGGEWVYTSTAVSSNFNFPDFKWLGGFSYLVSLKVYGACGSETSFTDTVHVPSGAWIGGDTLKIYPNIPGHTSTVLKGFASNYSSFTWSPTTGLTNSNTLNPTASPTVTTKYILTATKGTCTVKDSVVVRVLDCANAGYDRTICKGDSTYIGFAPPPPCIPTTLNTVCEQESMCAANLYWKADSTLVNPNSSGTLAWPTVTTTYTLYAVLELFDGESFEDPPVITYDTVEVDHITVYVDTLPGTLFGVTYQVDSTVHFNNYTLTINGATYLWIFGDGDSSTAINPIHTFSAFDSSYVVCLQATNACGMRQHCDTVWVDSLHIGLYAFGKRGSGDEPPTWMDEDAPTNKPQQLQYQNVLGNNKPNPFNHTTQIDYELKPDYQTANINITNTLSQHIQTIPLHALKGSVVIDANTLQKGMYYYNLVVDGKLVAVKRMVVQ